jgi:hypothetical protein
MASITREFMRHVVPGIVRPLRVLWNEVIGFMFLALGVIFGSGTWRAYKKFEAEGEGLAAVIMAAGLTLLMVWFGVTSFLRARKLGRTP